MSDETAPKPSKPILWISYVLSALPVLMLAMGSVMSFLKPPEALKGMEHLGWPEHLSTPIGIVNAICTLLYVIPQTAILGAILLTGYLGGAVATHLRVGDPLIQVLFPVIFGVIIWLALFLREPRLRKLVPIRR